MNNPIHIKVNIKVNGVAHQQEVEPRMLLAHFLRDRCKLTGTHLGCETTLCGACTVLLDGQAVKSCTVLAVQADGAEITTIEGLAKNGQLHPVQQGFWECHGLQCGYCTPGMILAGVQLLQRSPHPTREEIAHSLEGNLCRCTGYSHIIDAVDFAARQMAAPPPAKAKATAKAGPKIKSA
ncbi:MAG TPA: (2Fe-2S)-binding protein [Verrucomicrobiae bacterium]|nr:(2Fe-2S)-binding protein [Verrucomicrobiae bacterium]